MFVRVCVCTCLSSPFCIRDSPTRHDIVPLPGALGLGGGGVLCLHSRGCTLTHVAPVGTFFDTVSPLNSL